MNCSEVQELAELYVVGALEPEVAADVEAHLTECALCRGTVESLAGPVEALRLGLPPVAPPAALRERILGIPYQGAAAVAHPALVGERQDAGEAQSASGGLLRRLWPRLATAAALCLLLVSGWLGMQYAELRGEVQTARAELARLQAYDQALAIIQQAVQDGGAVVSVEGTEMAPTARGMVYAPLHGREGVLMVVGLPPQPGDWGYQLWLIRGDTRLPGGYFEPEPSGRCLLKIDAPMPLDQFDSFGITNEQRGGGPEPKGKRYMWGRNQQS